MRDWGVNATGFGCRVHGSGNRDDAARFRGWGVQGLGNLHAHERQEASAGLAGGRRPPRAGQLARQRPAHPPLLRFGGGQGLGRLPDNDPTRRRSKRFVRRSVQAAPVDEAPPFARVRHTLPSVALAAATSLGADRWGWRGGMGERGGHQTQGYAPISENSTGHGGAPGRWWPRRWSWAGEGRRARLPRRGARGGTTPSAPH